MCSSQITNLVIRYNQTSGLKVRVLITISINRLESMERFLGTRQAPNIETGFMESTL